jgi:hypothetical protein
MVETPRPEARLHCDDLWASLVALVFFPHGKFSRLLGPNGNLHAGRPDEKLKNFVGLSMCEARRLKFKSKYIPVHDVQVNTHATNSQFSSSARGVTMATIFSPQRSCEIDSQARQQKFIHHWRCEIFLMNDESSTQLLGAEIGVGRGTPFCRALSRQNSILFQVNLSFKHEAPGCIRVKNRPEHLQ